MPPEGLDEIRIVEQRLDFGTDILAHVVAYRGDVGHNLGPSVEHGDDVLEVVAGDDIVAAASAEGLRAGSPRSTGCRTSALARDDVVAAFRFRRAATGLARPPASPRRLRLSAARDGCESVTLLGASRFAPPPQEVEDAVHPLIAFQHEPQNRIHVPDDLRVRHPAIARTKAYWAAQN